MSSLRQVLLLMTILAVAALGVAFGSEWFGGLVPCPLCLVERWPYRVAIACGLVGLVLPQRLARIALALLALSVLAGVAVGGIHVGVEQHWWPSPLPECAAPHFSAGSIAQRLASMPALPSKSCEDATYLIPWLPISMAAMNFIYALVISLGIAMFLRNSKRKMA